MRMGVKLKRKRFWAFFLISVFAFLMAGCSTFKSYTYKVDTGDQIEIRLDTSGGYDISAELPFMVSKDNKILSQGTFITADGYEQYVQAVMSDSQAVVIEQKTRAGLEYIFYSYQDSEYNYVIRVTGSDTGLLIGNAVSEESARECFDRITIRKK